MNDVPTDMQENVDTFGIGVPTTDSTFGNDIERILEIKVRSHGGAGEKGGYFHCFFREIKVVAKKKKDMDHEDTVQMKSTFIDCITHSPAI